MSLAFTQIKVGPTVLRNRFLRSATWEGLCDDNGFAKPQLLKQMVKLSEGHVGLIIPGFAFVQKNGKAIEKQLGLNTDAHAELWRDSISQIHKNGSKIMFQLVHGGAKSIGDSEKVTPSSIGGRELKIAEIEDIIDAFTQSAIRAKKVGADGIQLHGAHGLLISYFLSPLTNKRTDKYGGSTEKRVRFAAEIGESIKKATGNEFAVGIKINGDEYYPGGVDKEIAAQHMNLLKSKLDFFEISCQLFNEGPRACRFTRLNPEEAKKEKFPFFEGYLLEYTEYIKKMNPDAIISAVGGMRTLEFIESTLKNGKADLISMSRPFIRDPMCVKRMEDGKIAKVECKNCGECYNLFSSNGIRCTYP